MKKSEIKELLNKRDFLYKKHPQNQLVDEISSDIIAVFRDKSEDYEVDFMIESLTRFGLAPSILYDDNGMFAVTCDGFQPIVTGKQRINGTMTFAVKKKQWKKTIREALKYFINEL